MEKYKILIWYLTIVFLVNVLIIKHSEPNNLIEYNLTDYGIPIAVQQFEDGKILINTMNGSSYLLYFIYQNGSIIPVNYHFTSNLFFKDFKPLTTDHVLMIYEDTEESSLIGVIINLNSHGKTTDKVVLEDHYNGSSYYTITDYSSISQSFVFIYRTYDPRTYRRDNYLYWTKYRFSPSDGTVTPIVNGSIKPPKNGFDITNHHAFTTFDDISLFYHYDAPEYLIYAQLIKNEDPSRDSLKKKKNEDQREQFLLYTSYDVTILFGGPGAMKCQSGFRSLDFQSNICIYTESAEYRSSKYTQFMKFIKFSSSGSVIDTGTLNITNIISDPFTYDIYLTTPLPYGGAILFFKTRSNPINYTTNYTFQVQTFDLDTMVNGDILYTNTWNSSNFWNIELKYYGVFSNNTAWFIQHNESFDSTYNSYKLIIVDIKQVYKDFGYENSAITSSYPEINSTVPLSHEFINISFSFRIIASSGNISVYQVINQDTFLLRQIYSASSYCNAPNSTTLSCKLLSSTFNRVNSNYFIVASDDFVRTSIYHEPVRGIKKGIWNVITPQQAYYKISESTEALLRLNYDGASYFSSYNQSQLLDDLLQQIKHSFPLLNNRLKITHNVQSDPSDPSKLLIEFSIDKATDPLIDPSVNKIINDLDIIIKSKYISALSDKTSMIFIDEQYGFQVKRMLFHTNI
ncbi:31358_t:CDS:2 [Gigaspora margarita]|uniref:31358_t:CDS:1 n=1 Tax=Gigaspora margarita TaxID=4874 RepID=A0ABN7UXH9_GIGMA|nr:31358_t:CDS:2 [Gigaspora margarita]